MAVGTMKRKLKWIAVLLAVLLLGFGTALFLWPRDRITPASWKDIRIGMTEKEVEDILGSRGITFEEFEIQTNALANLVPDGASRSEPDLSRFCGNLLEERLRGACPKYWIGRRGYLAIVVLRGQVVIKNFYGWKSADPNIIDRLRDWLGW